MYNNGYKLTHLKNDGKTYFWIRQCKHNWYLPSVRIALNPLCVETNFGCTYFVRPWGHEDSHIILNSHFTAAGLYCYMTGILFFPPTHTHHRQKFTLTVNYVYLICKRQKVTNKFIITFLTSIIKYCEY